MKTTFVYTSTSHMTTAPKSALNIALYHADVLRLTEQKIREVRDERAALETIANA